MIGTREAAVAHRTERDAARRLRRRLPEGRRSLEPHARRGRTHRSQLPHVGFNRSVGTFARRRISPSGTILTEAEWASAVAQWLPTSDDREYVESLMVGVQEPGTDGRVGRASVQGSSREADRLRVREALRQSGGCDGSVQRHANGCSTATSPADAAMPLRSAAGPIDDLLRRSRGTCGGSRRSSPSFDVARCAGAPRAQ